VADLESVLKIEEAFSLTIPPFLGAKGTILRILNSNSPIVGNKSEHSS
jgi:hypothetical protein